MVSPRTEIQRFDVYFVQLEPTVGVEMNKARPCVVLSRESMHRATNTVIIGPLTSRIHRFPTRVPCQFRGRSGEIALDQLRAVDRVRLLKRLGALDDATARALRAALAELFK